MEMYTVSPSTATPPLSTVPDEIKAWNHWVGSEHAGGKKRPLDPSTGNAASTKEPKTWGTFPEATARFERVGFVFTDADPYTGIDLDDCIDPETGEVHPAADEIVTRLCSYSEVSSSGTGIKGFARAVKPGGRCSTTDTPWGGKFEMYDRGRFFEVTGRAYGAAPLRDAQEAINALYERFLGSDQRATVTPIGRPSGPVSLSDNEVLSKARNCRRTGPRVSELLDSGYSVVPVGERSEADLFLCSRLAYWTGGDVEQVKRLFRLSDLARGKYAEKEHHGESYLDGTVRRAIRERRTFYDPSEGERAKERVRAVVRDHRERLEGADLSGSKRRVMKEMLRIAEEVGSYRDGGVEFNANQYAIAAAVGVSQEMVSKAIRRLMSGGLIVRKSRGNKKAGKNSYYRLEET